ncbi:hypothetical protein BJ742DRAFT_772288 [Cladochytrium replicatum]|nr:hypothetical protein BJ742DRAFT_772288 [Cladochytrium replicatum]
MEFLSNNTIYNATTNSTIPRYVNLREKELKDGQFYGLWDFIYFCLFDRWLQVFDIPTLLIIFIEGRQCFQKKISRTLVLHWIFRNIGGLVWAVITFAMQTPGYPRENTWRFNVSIPTVFWYAGELLIDSYPFQKAISLANNSSVLKSLCYIGFIPVVLAKSAIVVFRYVYTYMATDKNTYFFIANQFDAAVILCTTWSDICCCAVIVHVGAKSMKLKVGNRNQFISELVATTEMRMVACTLLSVLASSLMFAEGCRYDSSAGNCEYDGARDVAVTVVYTLYYLDFLILKYHNVVKQERANLIALKGTQGQGPMQWPNLGQFSPRKIGGTTTVQQPGMSYTVRSDEASSYNPYLGGGSNLKPNSHNRHNSDSPSFNQIKRSAERDGSFRTDEDTSFIVNEPSRYWIGANVNRHGPPNRGPNP